MQRIIFLFILFFLTHYSYAEEEYFLTLRNEKVNLRQGPSFDYPVKIIYKKKFLPVIVFDKSDNFRKIRDHENNTGWIHISQLSKKKAAITIDNQIIIFSKASFYSTPIAIMKQGRHCIIKKCKGEWCNISVDKYDGWVRKTSLWGLL